MLAVSETVIPGNKSIERSWAPLWSLYRAEYNPKTRRASRSLLWNLWRRDAQPGEARHSFLFGAVRTRRDVDGVHWRFLWQSFPKPKAPEPTPAVPEKKP